MHGFYRSTYRDSSGEERVILSTQFEATYARRAFPCFDEPDRKAKFRISVVIPDHLTALSCMPEVSRNPVETCELQKYGLPTATSHPYVKVDFDETPLMSTYIVAFVVGRFDYTEARDVNGVRIRVYTPPNRSYLGAHALRMARSALPFFTEVFGTGYPLPKLDLVAIPDFAMGAMENWGLLTYRETRLLVDETGSSLMSKRGVALTVAHEVAHMWFGNLVTMKWWTHLWLNEGFATWIEYLAVDHCFPEYDIWTVFLTDEISNAMATDELKTSHPIEVEVHSPDEVAEIFDAVSYKKGSSIIRMINDYVGPEKFMKGLQLYIQRHKYGNTTTDDLWNALSEVCGEDVGSIMSTWTRQTGFPALTVHKVSDTAEDGLVISIQQDRFLAEGGYSDDTSEWYVPVTICEAADSTKILKRVLVPPSARTQAFSVHLPSGWQIRLNPGAVGFYRVQYEGSLMGPILEALGERRLENRDRLCVLVDAFALARAGRIRMTSALTMASTLHCEGDYIVWCELRTELGKLRSLLQERCATSNDASGVEATTPFEEALNTFIIHLAEPPFKQLGWEAGKKESNNAILLRPLLIAMLGAAGAPEVVARATALFDRHYKAVMSCDKGDADGCGAATTCGDIIPADLRVAVYSTCMRHGGDDVYERLLNLYERATMHDERVRILHCVGCTGQSALAKRVIGLAFSDLVRKQDRLFPLMSLSSGSAIGRRAVWREIQRRIDTLMEDLAATSIVSHVISLYHDWLPKVSVISKRAVAALSNVCPRLPETSTAAVQEQLPPSAPGHPTPPNLTLTPPELTISNSPPSPEAMSDSPTDLPSTETEDSPSTFHNFHHRTSMLMSPFPSRLQIRCMDEDEDLAVIDQVNRRLALGQLEPSLPWVPVPPGAGLLGYPPSTTEQYSESFAEAAFQHQQHQEMMSSMMATAATSLQGGHCFFPMETTLPIGSGESVQYNLASRVFYQPEGNAQLSPPVEDPQSEVEFTDQ